MSTYLRYRIDASRDLGSDRLHSASEAVQDEWHDTVDDAIAYAQQLIDDDPTLILAVHEYGIDADVEPTHDDWVALRTQAPRRVLWRHDLLPRNTKRAKKRANTMRPTTPSYRRSRKGDKYEKDKLYPQHP